MSEKMSVKQYDNVDVVVDDDDDDDGHLTLPLENAIHYVFRLTTSYGWGDAFVIFVTVALMIIIIIVLFHLTFCSYK